MDPKAFFEAGQFLSHLSLMQLEENFDLPAIVELSDTRRSRNQVRLLAQYMAGMVDRTFSELSLMCTSERRKCLLTWSNLLKQGHQDLLDEVILHMLQ